MTGAMRVSPSSSAAEMDQALSILQANKREWARLPVAEKHDLLLTLRANLARSASRWVELSIEGTALDPDSPLVGELWAGGPWAFAAGINSLLRSTEALAAGRLPRPSKLWTRPNGQLVGQVYPADIYDRLLVNDLRVEVWMQPGITEENLSDHTAMFYKRPDPPGEVCLVLGAGNVSAISALDVLHQLYVLGQVVLLKMNPVNDYLGPVLEEIFQTYIDAGYLQLLYGGANVGAHLVDHDDVELIHMTGSVQTYETIVFGQGPQGQSRKERSAPVCPKPISCELGGVGPVIIVPGPWEETDIQYQAENIATIKLHNVGYNCVSGQVLVLPQEWDQSDPLLDAVRQLMKELPPRQAYYPGTADRQQAIMEHYPEAEQFGGPVPRTLITGLDPDKEQYFFEEEVFGPILGQVSISGATPSEFLQNAVHFANEKLQGTLGATIIVHPKTARKMGPVLEAAVADLRYGTIGINVWNAGAFLLGQAVWGGYPGATKDDIQSGQGFVHNSLMFDKALKTVLRGSFYPFPRAWRHGEFHIAPKPSWFVTNKTAHTTLRRVTQLATDPHPKHLPGIFLSALRG